MLSNHAVLTCVANPAGNLPANFRRDFDIFVSSHDPGRFPVDIRVGANRAVVCHGCRIDRRPMRSDAEAMTAQSGLQRELICLDR